MKARTKFTKMYYKLPLKARKELSMRMDGVPFSLNVCMIEIQNKTALGFKMLLHLGFEND